MNAQVVNEWIKKAEDNYSSALTLSRRRNRPVPDVICNQCQQCIEKYLKALLTRYKISFPKTHDLMQLEELVAPADAEIRSIHAEFLTLNPYGIDIRYPGLEASLEEAKQALRAMKSARKFFRFKLGLWQA